MPDLRTVAARAGERPRPGGGHHQPTGVAADLQPRRRHAQRRVAAERTVDRTCTFALEIFMIVAMFVFSLFLPIVVLLFQLWWLLALRFCPPSAGQAASLLTRSSPAARRWRTSSTPPSTPTPPTPPAAQTHLDLLLGAKGTAAELAKIGSKSPADRGADPVATLHPTDVDLAANDPGAQARTTPSAPPWTSTAQHRWSDMFTDQGMARQRTPARSWTSGLAPACASRCGPGWATAGSSW